MQTLQLSDLQQTITRNRSYYQEVIANFDNELNQMNINKKRMRPKDPTEKRILLSFKRK